MASIMGFYRRNQNIRSPPEPPKAPDAIRFGLLGASNIAPMAIIAPAKSHPEVIIAAIAARDQVKATAYAKKHGISKVHTCYQDLIDDPTIDAIYVPLPMGLHYEWTIRSLRAGKHVLLEKPSVSNAAEAKLLFNHHASLPDPKPVLLEAFHYYFHPSFHYILSLLTPSAVTETHSSLSVPAGMLAKDDLRFNFDLAGGALMDAGTYGVSVARHIFGAEPIECLTAEPVLRPPPGDKRCDQAFTGRWKFPNGGVGHVYADLVGKGPLGIPWLELPRLKVVQKPIPVESHAEDGDARGKLGEGEKHEVARTLEMTNHIVPTFWHGIWVTDVHFVKGADGTVLRTWTTRETRNCYTWKEAGEGMGGIQAGEDWWTSYRFMLEEFVNKVKKRQGSGIWMEGDDSIKQMAMIDSGYLKAGMDVRPSMGFK